MAEHDKRKKKRGRKPKLNLRSCFPTFAPPEDRPSSSSNYYCKSDYRNLNNGRRRLGKLISVDGCDNREFMNTDVDIVDGAVNVNAGDRDRSSSHRRRISRLFKAVLFDSFMVKKINRSSSKSSNTSDTTESSSSLSTEKTVKSTNHNHPIRDREYTDFDSSLLSSSSRTTSSSRCSSSHNSQWSSEQKTSSRIDLVDLKPNPISDPPPVPKPKPKQKPKHQISVSWNSICWCLFIFLSLVVLVVYGRIYSILCTSTWFYFVPCGKMKRVDSVGDSVKVVDTDSEQYKKRVIMAGLLDRTRNPLR